MTAAVQEKNKKTVNGFSIEIQRNKTVAGHYTVRIKYKNLFKDMVFHSADYFFAELVQDRTGCVLLNVYINWPGHKLQNMCFLVRINSKHEIATIRLQEDTPACNPVQEFIHKHPYVPCTLNPYTKHLAEYFVEQPLYEDQYFLLDSFHTNFFNLDGVFVGLSDWQAKQVVTMNPDHPASKAYQRARLVLKLQNNNE